MVRNWNQLTKEAIDNKYFDRDFKPVDPDNPEYKQWLEQVKTQLKEAQDSDDRDSDVNPELEKASIQDLEDEVKTQLKQVQDSDNKDSAENEAEHLLQSLEFNDQTEERQKQFEKWVQDNQATLETYFGNKYVMNDRLKADASEYEVEQKKREIEDKINTELFSMRDNFVLGNKEQPDPPANLKTNNQFDQSKEVKPPEQPQRPEGMDSGQPGMSNADPASSHTVEQPNSNSKPMTDKQIDQLNQQQTKSPEQKDSDSDPTKDNDSNDSKEIDNKQEESKKPEKPEGFE